MAVEFLEIKVQLDGAEEATNQLNALKKSVKGVSKSAEETEEASDKTTASLKRSASGMGKIVKSLGRVAFYRAIRTAIKGVTDALTEGLQNAYAYSRTMNGSLYQSLNRIASASEKMKNQLGAAFGTLIESLEPAITWAINVVTKIAEAITKLIAALSGKSTYLKAKDVTKEWADETQKGADAAEEWKNQLLGFDEINKLEDNTSSGSGLDDGDDYGDLFEEVPLEGWALKLKELMDKIRGFFTDLWNFIKPWLENALTTIQEFFADVWDTISEWATNAWEWLVTAAETVGEFFSSIYETISEGIANVIEAVRNLFTTIISIVTEKLQNIKQKISEFCTSVVTAIQTAFGANTSVFTTMFTAIATALSTVIDTCHSLLKGAYSNIGAFISGTAESLASWVSACANIGTAFGKSIATGVYEGLSNAWKNINSFLKGTHEGFVSWAQGVAETFHSAAQSALKTISSLAQSAWNAISNFASALGVKLGNWWSDNGDTAIKVGAGVAAAGLTVAAIALAAPSLGSSLAGLGASLSALGSVAAIGAFANGGTPSTGSLFIAGERGAELISSSGNGTSVSNTNQIADSVRSGNENVVNAIYAMANAIVNSVDSKDTGVYLDGKQVAYGIKKYESNVSRGYGKNFVSIV